MPFGDMLLIGHLKKCRLASRQQVKCLSRQAALAPAATPGNIFRCALVGFIVLRVLLIGYAVHWMCCHLGVLLARRLPVVLVLQLAVAWAYCRLILMC
jgi:hypothetical protein